MLDEDRLIEEVDTSLGRFKVIEKIYTERPARVLYSTQPLTAQSGIPLDDDQTMLFGYNCRLVELINQIKPSKTLLIGGGTYTLPSYVTATNDNINFDVVEPNSDLDKIAAKYFNYHPSSRINVYHDHGGHYLKVCVTSYDLIIIDAFVEHLMADEVFTSKFVKSLTKCLKK